MNGDQWNSSEKVKKAPGTFSGSFVYALAFLLLASARVHAADAGAPGSIFDFGAGARPLAMGGAYSAEARDATALYYNPAGLSMMNNRNVSLMHATLFEGMSYDYLGYAQNYGGLPGGWGVQVMRLSAGTAQGRDDNNQPTSSFGYTETAFAVGTGIHGLFLPSLSVGGSLKVLNRTLGTDSNRLIGLDIGMQYGPVFDEKLTLALVAQNFGSFATGDTADKLPLGLKLGAAYALNSNISLSADLSGSSGLQFGSEYLMGPGALRVGYNSDGFSFGAGIKFMKAYQLDYAMFKDPVLGLSNRVSLSYVFGGVSAPPKIRSYAKDYLKKAENDIKDRDFSSAFDNVGMAIGMDPGIEKGSWGEKYRRLSELVSGLKLKELPERQKLLRGQAEQPAEAGRALTEYVEGNNLKSMLLAHSALGYQPDNALYSDLLSMLSRLTSMEIRRDEILPRVMLVNMKLEKAATAFYAQDFIKAVKECSEVLLIDEGNAEAWKKTGSAYFAAGETAKAKYAYEKVLELHPQDGAVIKFMTLQGWR